MNINIPELQRKYKVVEQVGSKLLITLDATSYGKDLYINDGAWVMQQGFLGRIYNDVLKAMGLQPEDAMKNTFPVRCLQTGPTNIVVEISLHEKE